MSVTGKTTYRFKILINNKIIQQRRDFLCLRNNISLFEDQKYIERKLMKYNKLNGV
jgi:hypothetical protein